MTDYRCVLVRYCIKALAIIFLLPSAVTAQSRVSSATGFFVTNDGYLITNFHVVREQRDVKVRVTNGTEYAAQIVRVDRANDIAVLKVDGLFEALPLDGSPNARRGEAVATLGFPLVPVQGMEPKFTDGIISSPTGIQDDPRMFQITVPVQPGSSGGPLVDLRGNVIGIVTSRLSTAFTIRSSGEIPQNVNFAVKSSYIRAVMESVPGLAGRLLPLRVHALADKTALAEYMEKAVAIVTSVTESTITATVASAGWVKVGGNNNVDAYMDLKLLEKKGTYVMSWRLYDYRSPQKSSSGKTFLSAATLDVINCADRTEAMTSFVQYDQAMGKGNIVASDKLAQGEWKINRITPNSIGEALSSVACRRFKMW